MEPFPWPPPPTTNLPEATSTQVVAPTSTHVLTPRNLAFTPTTWDLQVLSLGGPFSSPLISTLCSDPHPPLGDPHLSFLQWLGIYPLLTLLPMRRWESPFIRTEVYLWPSVSIPGHYTYEPTLALVFYVHFKCPKHNSLIPSGRQTSLHHPSGLISAPDITGS